MNTHEIRNQIGAPLELHADLRFGGIDLLIVGLDGVVAASGEQKQGGSRRRAAHARGHGRVLSGKRFTYSVVRAMAAR
jgi:hypothetical protein